MSENLNFRKNLQEKYVKRDLARSSIVFSQNQFIWKIFKD